METKDELELQRENEVKPKIETTLNEDNGNKKSFVAAADATSGHDDKGNQTT